MATSKSHTQKRSIWFAFFTLLLLMCGYDSTPIFAAPSEDVYVSSKTTDTSKQALSGWFHSKQSTHANKAISPKTSSDIWTRVRGHFNIRSTQTSLIQHHVKRLSKSQDQINLWVRNASPYLFYILEEVERRGMPSEIALLPMIESTFNPNDLSHKGAAGIWQIMPTLGRMHGLKQNSWYDGRKDIYESTRVALDHLQYLHKRFNGNWLLALAAYNSGEAKVMRAIKINRTAKKPTDFWSLKLPKETVHFVPKLLALAVVVKSPHTYGVSLASIPNRPVFTRINVGKPINITHAAKLVDMSETQLRKLNPGIHKKGMDPSGPFHLVVPIQHAHISKEKIQQVAKAPVEKTTAHAKTKVKAKTIKKPEAITSSMTIAKSSQTVIKVTKAPKKATPNKAPAKKKNTPSSSSKDKGKQASKKRVLAKSSQASF